MPDFIDELKRVAEAIKVTAETIKAVEQAQSAFDRSATLEVRNTTGRKLIFHDAMHDHGAFSKQPDLPIEPGTSEVYGTRTSGILTGTAGAAPGLRDTRSIRRPCVITPAGTSTGGARRGDPIQTTRRRGGSSPSPRRGQTARTG